MTVCDCAAEPPEADAPLLPLVVLPPLPPPELCEGEEPLEAVGVAEV
jgi:hypothetical protein